MSQHKFLLSWPISLFMFLALDVQAQSSSGCMAEDHDQVITSNQISWPDNRHKYRLNPHHWLDIQAMKHLPAETVWLDVRPKANAQAGLLVIGLEQLTVAMQNFADKTVVLVGTGFDQMLLDQQITALQQQGFRQVQALAGGIRTWQQLRHQPSEQQITAEDLLTGGQTLPWQIITWGLSDRQQQLLPEKPVRHFATDQAGVQQLQQFLQQQSVNYDYGIHYVLVTADQRMNHLLQPQLTAEYTSTVVWLQGGWKRYQQYVQQQANIVRHQGHSLHEPCRLSL